MVVIPRKLKEPPVELISGAIQQRALLFAINHPEQFVNQDKEDRVALDCAANLHVNPCEDWFVEGTVVICHIECVFGEGSTVVTKKGMVRMFSWYSDGIIELIECLYMPTCPYFLVAENKLDRNGSSIYKRNGVVTVRHYGDSGLERPKVFVTGRLRKDTGLYHLDVYLNDPKSYDKDDYPYIEEDPDSDDDESEDDKGAGARPPPTNVLTIVAKKKVETCTQSQTQAKSSEKAPAMKNSVGNIQQIHAKDLESQTNLDAVVRVKNIQKAQVFHPSAAELMYEHVCDGHRGFNGFASSMA